MRCKAALAPSMGPDTGYRIVVEEVSYVKPGDRVLCSEVRLGRYELTYMDFLLGEKITGCVMGGVTLRRDIPKYMEMYRSGQIDIDSLLTNRFTLEQIREALTDPTQGALKNVVIIGKED